MITFGICLIYYGVALFLYQIHGWLIDGVWTPFPVRRAWEEFFGAPGLFEPPLDAFVHWLLAWPLSLALLTSGSGVLAVVYAVKRLMALRRDRQRRDWILKQCEEAGYRPWTVPKVLRELDDRLQAEKSSRREEVG